MRCFVLAMLLVLAAVVLAVGCGSGSGSDGGLDGQRDFPKIEGPTTHPIVDLPVFKPDAGPSSG
jgi:hypothetical protein